MRVARENLARARRVGNASNDGQRLSQPVELVHGRAVEMACRQAAVHARFLDPELGIDGLLQAAGPGRVTRRLRVLSLFPGQRGSERDGLVVGDVGGQGLGARHRGQVVHDPCGVALVAPVEEGLLALVQATGFVVGGHAVALQRVGQGLEGARRKRGPFCCGQGIEHARRAEGPADAVCAHWPAATAAGVLDDLQSVFASRDLCCARHASTPGRELEFERVFHALRVQHRQSQVCRVRQVTGPDVVPFFARFKARASDRCAPVVVAVLDLADGILAHFRRSQREQGIKREVAGADNGQSRRLAIARVLRTGVAQLLRGRMRVGTLCGVGIGRGEAHDFVLAVEGRNAQRHDALLPRVASMGIDGNRLGRLQARDLQLRTRRVGQVEPEAIGRRAAHEQVILRPRARGHRIGLAGSDAHARCGVNHPFGGPVAAANFERVVAGAEQHFGFIDAIALGRERMVGAPAVEAAAHVQGGRGGDGAGRQQGAQQEGERRFMHGACPSDHVCFFV